MFMKPIRTWRKNRVGQARGHKPKVWLAEAVPGGTLTSEQIDLLRRGLEELADLRLLAESTMESNQKRAYAYLRWCKGNHLKAVPCSADQAENYLRHLLEAKNLRSSDYLRSILSSAIVWLHRLIGDEDFVIPKRCFRLIRAGLKLGELHHPEPSDPITAKVLTDLTRKLNINDRNEAVVLLGVMIGYDTALRCSEMLSLRKEDMTLHDDGSATVFVRKTKTDQTMRGAVKNLSRTTVSFMIRFYALHGGQDSAYLVPKLSQRGTPYVTNQWSRLLRAALDKYGYSNISTHGMRVGWAHDAFNNGVDAVRACQYVGWVGLDRFAYYNRNNIALDVGRSLAGAVGR